MLKKHFKHINDQFKKCSGNQSSIHDWIEFYLNDGYYIKLTTFLIRRGIFDKYKKRKVTTIHGCFNSIPHLELKCEELIKKHGRFRLKDEILVIHKSSLGDPMGLIDIGFKTFLPGRIAVSLTPLKDNNAASINKDIAYSGDKVVEYYYKPTRESRKRRKKQLSEFMNDKQKVREFINALIGKTIDDV